MSPNTKQRSEHLRTLAQSIVRESNPDYNNTVHILPLAKQLMAAGECGIDAAKRHIAWAIRNGRHNWLVEKGIASDDQPTKAQHGGKRPNATGRPKKNVISKQAETSNCLLTNQAAWFIMEM